MAKRRFAKRAILDVWQGSEYASIVYLEYTQRLLSIILMAW